METCTIRKYARQPHPKTREVRACLWHAVEHVPLMLTKSEIECAEEGFAHYTPNYTGSKPVSYMAINSRQD